MAEAVLYRPQTHQRYRQFGQIREQRSQKSHISRSRIDDERRSIGGSFVKKLDYEQSRKGTIAHQKTNRNSRKNVKQLHSKSFNDFGETRSRRNHYSRNLQKSSKLLCVGCYNKQLCEHRQHERHQQEEHQKQINNFSLINQNDPQHKRARRRFDREYQKTKQYNLMLIEKHRKQKERQNQQKMHQQQRNRQKQEQNYRYRQKQADIAAKRRQELRKDLEQQIERRRMKTLAEQRDKQYDNKMQESFFGTVEGNRQKIRHMVEEEYRRDLINQIQQKKQKQKTQARMEVQRKREQELALMQQAVEIERKKKQEENRRKNILLEEARIRKQRQARLEQQKNRNRLEEQKVKMAELQIQHKQWQKKQNQRRSQIDKYLDDLKKQINFNKKRKAQQYNYTHEPTNTSIIADRRKVPERECDSCQKRYPQMYLTRVPVTQGDQ